MCMMQFDNGVSTSLIDQSCSAEMARQIHRHKLLTYYLGLLFPEDIDPSEFQSVLDLGCGPGAWVQDVAFSYSDLCVIGVESCPTTVSYAHCLTHVQKRDNASYEVMDLQQPLDFTDESFEFVQARFLLTVLPAEHWPALLTDSLRILRPGGIMRLMEMEWPSTTSEAVQRIGELVQQALQKAGCSTQAYPSMQAREVALLHEAGFSQIQRRTYEIPLTAGWIGLHPLMGLLRTTLYLMEPTLLKWHITTPREWQALLERMENDACSEAFSGTMQIADSWGQKDLTSQAGEISYVRSTMPS